jgi:hypothetical protein
MKKYKVKIGYFLTFEITAKDEKEAAELAWFEFDQSAPHEPEIEVKEFDPETQGECKECGDIYNFTDGHRCMRL